MHYATIRVAWPTVLQIRNCFEVGDVTIDWKYPPKPAHGDLSSWDPSHRTCCEPTKSQCLTCRSDSWRSISPSWCCWWYLAEAFSTQESHLRISSAGIELPSAQTLSLIFKLSVSQLLCTVRFVNAVPIPYNWYALRQIFERRILGRVPSSWPLPQLPSTPTSLKPVVDASRPKDQRKLKSVAKFLEQRRLAEMIVDLLLDTIRTSWWYWKQVWLAHHLGKNRNEANRIVCRWTWGKLTKKLV